MARGISLRQKMSGTLQITDARLEPIAQKMLAGERLSADDGLALYPVERSARGRLAREPRPREAPRQHLLFQRQSPHQSHERLRRALQTLRVRPLSGRAGRLHLCSRGDLRSAPRKECAEGATEFHIVGGLHPDLPFEYYLDLIRGLKQRFPQVHLKAFTMVEVHYYARISKLSIRDTLLEMKEAGVDSLPGGGAEIFHPRVRQHHLRPQSQRAAVARRSRAPRTKSACARMPPCSTATSKRSKSASITCSALRESQDKTHGFVAFIPLAFHPANTGLSHLPKPHRLRRSEDHRRLAPAAR